MSTGHANSTEATNAVAAAAPDMILASFALLWKLILLCYGNTLCSISLLCSERSLYSLGSVRAASAPSATTAASTVASATSAAGASTFNGGSFGGPTPLPFMFGANQMTIGGESFVQGTVGQTPFGSTIGSTPSGSMGSMFGHTVGAFGTNVVGYGHMAGSMPTQPPRANATADKPPKFCGTDFKSWRQKMFFYLTTLGYVGYLTDNEPPTPAKNKTNFTVRAAYDAWHNDDFLCKNFLLGGLGDSLYKVYVDIKTSRACLIWFLNPFSHYHFRICLHDSLSHKPKQNSGRSPISISADIRGDGGRLISSSAAERLKIWGCVASCSSLWARATSGKFRLRSISKTCSSLWACESSGFSEAVPADCSDPRWRWFKGCLGALDGTYVSVTVGNEDKPRYRTRKGQISTNVLGVCDRHCNFSYVLSGWEGSAADSRVLRDAIRRPHGLKVPKGKYYLCDNGYANSEGFLTPFKSVRYHLKEWGPNNARPQNKEELFNLRHSKARNAIERAFGILKMRWGILRSPSFYPIRVQNRIIMACFLINNFIRKEMPIDPIEEQLDAMPPQNDAMQEEAPDEFVEQVESSPQWHAARNALAEAMWLQYDGGRSSM
ncbi:uncharacterized protein LOC131005322 [Salvia miltiorrhiza]|uniref:uncharacterized protein LOC131005322 n=1 Tax=Salvia miltiorrhiza TaxID=226208 RepID=UPI0025ACE0F0|nr:uncharacterized protein LOC131005322 [Salvia miltiorrhiza]